MSVWVNYWILPQKMKYSKLKIKGKNMKLKFKLSIIKNISHSLSLLCKLKVATWQELK